MIPHRRGGRGGKSWRKKAGGLGEVVTRYTGRDGGQPGKKIGKARRTSSGKRKGGKRFRPLPVLGRKEKQAAPLDRKVVQAPLTGRKVRVVFQGKRETFRRTGKITGCGKRKKELLSGDAEKSKAFCEKRTGPKRRPGSWNEARAKKSLKR